MTAKHLHPNPSPGSKRNTPASAPRRVLSKGPVAPGQPPQPPEVAPGHAAESESMQLPHERDESRSDDATSLPGSGFAGEHQRAVGRQAANDLKEGQVDTDLHGSAGLDAQKREQLLNAQQQSERQASRRKT